MDGLRGVFLAVKIHFERIPNTLFDTRDEVLLLKKKYSEYSIVSIEHSPRKVLKKKSEHLENIQNNVRIWNDLFGMASECVVK